MGIPENDIIIENKSRNTHENAFYTGQLFEKNGFSKSNNLLITSSMHMRRAQACFENKASHVPLLQQTTMPFIQNPFLLLNSFQIKMLL